MLVFLVIALVLTLLLESPSVDVESKAAIVMDASTGEILYEKNAQTAYSVASISKLMTIYMVLENISAGEIAWNEPVLMTDTANNLVDTAVKLTVVSGDILTVEELFTAMLVASSNNAAVALAEHIAGTEQLFTEMMNEQARMLGLSGQVLFVNASGLPSREHDNAENEMTATDVAKLAKVLLEKYESIVLPKASLTSYFIESQDIEIVTTNNMLGENGVDGLKTGYTNMAGYSFAGTAKQGDKRLITVVLDAIDADGRFVETNKLLEMGFKKSNFEFVKKVVKKIKNEVKARL